MVDFWGYTISISICLFILSGFFLVIRAVGGDSSSHGLIKEILEIMTSMVRPVQTDRADGEDVTTEAPVSEDVQPYEETCPGCSETVTHRDRSCPSCGLRLMD